MLTDALSRNPDPEGETFKHMVPPSNMPAPKAQLHLELAWLFPDVADVKLSVQLQLWSPSGDPAVIGSVDGAAAWRAEGYDVSGRTINSSYRQTNQLCP